MRRGQYVRVTAFLVPFPFAQGAIAEGLKRSGDHSSCERMILLTLSACSRFTIQL